MYIAVETQGCETWWQLLERILGPHKESSITTIKNWPYSNDIALRCMHGKHVVVSMMLNEFTTYRYE